MIVLITGASRGMGAEVAFELAKAQHTLILVSRSQKRIEQVATRCNEIAGSDLAVPLLFDINDLADIEGDFVNLLKAHTNSIDTLINNAGFLVNKPFEEITQPEIHAMISANVLAPANLIRLVLPFLKNARSPHVVNITSMAGFQGSSKFRGLSWYSATKAALGSLTECLAEEYADAGICFNGLAPGAVQTEMLNEAFPGFRAPISPAGMAEFIAWFALNGQKFFNGKHLPVALQTP